MDDADTAVLNDIEEFWAKLDHMDLDFTRVKVLPGSDFASDEAVLPEVAIAAESLDLILAALDHVKLLREQAGNKPRGFGVWRMRAPGHCFGRLLRWRHRVSGFACEDEQHLRIERVLQLTHDNMSNNIKAQVLSMPPDQRDGGPFRERGKAWFDPIAKFWERDEKTANRMRNTVKLSECVSLAAKATTSSNLMILRSTGRWQVPMHTGGRGLINTRPPCVT